MKKLIFALFFVGIVSVVITPPQAHAQTSTCLQSAALAYQTCISGISFSDAQAFARCQQQRSQAETACQQGAVSSTGTTTPVTLTNPLGTTDIRLLIARLISAVLSIIGVIALLMFVYGGFLWMLSAGNESQVEKGKEVLKWTTIGIILIVSAYVIVNALFRAAFTGAL